MCLWRGFLAEREDASERVGWLDLLSLCNFVALSDTITLAVRPAMRPLYPGQMHA